MKILKNKILRIILIFLIFFIGVTLTNKVCAMSVTQDKYRESFSYDGNKHTVKVRFKVRGTYRNSVIKCITIGKSCKGEGTFEVTFSHTNIGTKIFHVNFEETDPSGNIIDKKRCNFSITVNYKGKINLNVRSSLSVYAGRSVNLVAYYSCSDGSKDGVTVSACANKNITISRVGGGKGYATFEVTGANTQKQLTSSVYITASKPGYPNVTKKTNVTVNVVDWGTTKQANQKTASNSTSYKSSSSSSGSSSGSSSSGSSSSGSSSGGGDTTAPTINAITLKDISKSITNRTSVTYQVTFSEAVKSFSAGGVSLSNGKGAITNVVGADGTTNIQKTWNVTTSQRGTYAQRLTVKANAAKDASGNYNTSSKNSSDLNIDTEKPVITVTSNSVTDSSGNAVSTTTLTKNNKLKINFKATDANLDTTILDSLAGRTLDYSTYKSYFRIREGGKDDGSAKIKITKKSGTSAEVQNIGMVASNSNDIAVNMLANTMKLASTSSSEGQYEIEATNLSGTGNLEIQALEGAVKDTATNTNAATSLLTTEIKTDNTVPELSTVTISSNGKNSAYAKVGDTVTISMVANVDYNDLTVKPTVTIGGKTATVSGNGKNWIASLKMTNDIAEGNLEIRISDYTYYNGMSGLTVTNTTDESTVIFDKTAPVIDGEIDYNSENGVPRNTTWLKEQSVTITAKDNYTASDKIACSYAWILEGDTSAHTYTTGTNGQAIVKNTDTGKYYVQVLYEDLAGNQSTINTDLCYIDNSITLPGRIITYNNVKNGTEYAFKKSDGTDYNISKMNDGESVTLYGGYTNNNIYIGLDRGRDDESGIKSSSYYVERVIDGQKIIGTPTSSDMFIENDGEYKVTYITQDNAGNVGTIVFYIYKGIANISIDPNGNSSYEKSVSTKLTLTDTINTYTSISYGWSTSKDDQNVTYTNISDLESLKTNGLTITKTGVTGIYYLYIKTVDNMGNENIFISEQFHIAGSLAKENVATMTFYTIDELTMNKIADYEPSTWTNKSVYLKLNNDGIDDLGNKLASSSYTITNSSGTIVGQGTTGSAILVNEGKYTVTVTSTTSLGVTGTRKYTVMIDKTAPTVEFSGTDTYETTGKIRVKVTDADSGVKSKEIRYYWTRNKSKPDASKFEADGDPKYIGTMIAATQDVSAPAGESGIWYLWIYASDEAGNSSIQSANNSNPDNTASLDNEPPIAGTIDMKKGNAEGEKYIPNGEYTNESIYLELKNGYDADSGVKSNTYSITKDGNGYKSNLNEPCTLTEDGEYKITVTTVDNKDNSSTREYTVKIDKTGPVINITPNGDKNYTINKNIGVNISDERAGVNNDLTKYYWIGYNPNKYSNFDEVKAKFEEIKAEVKAEELIDKLNEIGIYISNATINENAVSSPEGATGIYHLIITAKDVLENATTLTSNPYYLDGTNPTKPEIRGERLTIIGSKEEKVSYYGEFTNDLVYVISENSISLSGVDKYQYKITADGGNQWSDWTDATISTTENEKTNIYGKLEIQEEGTYIVKFRSVSELPDGSLYSDESEEFVVKIDLTGPEVKFSNSINGEDGYEKEVESIKVKVVVADKNGIDENSLRYQWIRFENETKYKEFINANNSSENLKAMMTTTNPFVNGEEIMTPVGDKGIYVLLQYAKDTIGNENINVSKYYILGSSTNEIIRVLPNTTVETFKNKYLSGIEGNNFKVYDKNGKEFNNESTSLITTDSTAIADGKTYKVAVVGDLNSDGKVSVIDVTRLRFNLVGKIEFDDVHKIAADINNDEKISIIDLSQLRMVSVGLLTITK